MSDPIELPQMPRLQLQTPSLRVPRRRVSLLPDSQLRLDWRPIRLRLTWDEMMRALGETDGTQTPEGRDLARALRQLGPVEVTQSSVLGDLATKVQSRIELRRGDWVIKPDLETIGRGLVDLLGL